jgi:hypothetical protein
VVGFHQDRIGLVFLDLDRGLQQYWILVFSGILEGWIFKDRIGLAFSGWVSLGFSLDLDQRVLQGWFGAFRGSVVSGHVFHQSVFLWLFSGY